RPRRNRAIEYRAATSAIERDSQEVDIPCERCWNVKPRRRYVIVPSLNKYSGYVRLGKKYSSPNVVSACKSLVIANISAYNKVDKEIIDAERQLSEALSRLSYLRR
ncbi:hypothetical protein C8A01DRAFT_21312, partial [Parachaetomium inaequale]